MAALTHRVLVGVDASSDAAHLVRVSTELARHLGAELHLVHVRLTRSTLHGRPMTPAQREAQEAEGRQLLDRLAAEARTGDFEVTETHLRFGDRVDTELTRAQQELQAGLLVVGRSRTGGVASRLVGSPASATVRRSPGSVLVVREPADADGDLL